MSPRSVVNATAFLFSILAPVAVSAETFHYEFHAVDPVIELASGDAVLVDLLKSSAAASNLHGRFSYSFDSDASVQGPIFNFSGNAWGLSFDFPEAGLKLYPVSRFGGSKDAIFVGPVYNDTAPEPIMLGEYKLVLAGLQYFQAPPWIPDNLGGGYPEDLSLLVGTPGLMELCLSGPDNRFGCLFIHGVETSEVPLPAGGGLLLSALAGLAAVKRRGFRA